MRKAINIFFILCFLLVILIPVLFINTNHNAVSDIDNRMLIEMPNFDDDGFGWKLETYLEDRIGFRTKIITEYANLHAALFNQLVHPSYMYGKDGHVFVQIHDNIQYSEYHKLFAETVRKMQDYCEDRGVKFYFMFEPEKTSVYREYLPNGIHYDDSWVEKMIGYMEELGVTVINNKELLIEKSKEEDVFNCKFDAYHWNDIGCYEGTNNLLKRIKEDFPQTELLPQGTMKNIKEQFLPQSRIVINETRPIYSILADNGEDITYIGEDISDQYIDEINISAQFDHFRYCVNRATEAKTFPRILSFQGSYYNEDLKEMRFFASRGSEYISIHNYQNVLNLDYYLNLFRPDIVVFEVAEYTLSDYYFASEKMNSLDWNPPIKLKYITEQKISSGGQCTLIVDQHFKIDKAYVSERLSQYDIKYVYLSIDGIPYDMIKNDVTGQYETSLQHDLVSNAKNVILLYSDSEDRISRMDLQIELRHSIMGPKNITNGVTKTAGRFTISTSVTGNCFDAVELMSIDEEDSIQIYKVAYEAGIYSGMFTHEAKSGWYTMRLVANSNLSDEYIDAKAWLNQGEEYYFSFTVDSLEKNQAVVTDYDITTKGNIIL